MSPRKQQIVFECIFWLLVAVLVVWLVIEFNK